MNFITKISLNAEYKDSNRMFYLVNAFQIVVDMLNEIEENDEEIQKHNCGDDAYTYHAMLEQAHEGLKYAICAENFEWAVDSNYLEQ